MQHSIDLLRKAERLALAYDPTDGYYLAFSGGKDSQALYHIAQIAGVKFRPHFSPTSVDPPEVIRFIRQQYPDVEFQRLTQSIYQQAIELGILPTMRVRWCCEKFKEHAGAGKVTLIGIRRAESARRAKRNEVEISNHKFSGDLEGFDQWSAKERERRKQTRRGRKPKTPVTPSLANPQEIKKESIVGCISGKESILVSPIIEWTDRDVWQFLNDVMQVPHCSLYDEGWRRLGCILCPMSQHAQKVKEMERWPHVKRNWIKAIKAIRRGGVFAEGFIWWSIPASLVPIKDQRGWLNRKPGPRQLSHKHPLSETITRSLLPPSTMATTVIKKTSGPTGFQVAPRLSA